MTQVLEQRIYTPDEYLELELASETRSEYRDRAIIPMTGGTPDRNKLAINPASLLKSALRGKSYRIFGSDQRLWVPNRNLYTYLACHGCRKTLTASSRAHWHSDQPLFYC